MGCPRPFVIVAGFGNRFRVPGSSRLRFRTPDSILHAPSRFFFSFLLLEGLHDLQSNPKRGQPGPSFDAFAQALAYRQGLRVEAVRNPRGGCSPLQSSLRSMPRRHGLCPAGHARKQGCKVSGTKEPD